MCAIINHIDSDRYDKQNREEAEKQTDWQMEESLGEDYQNPSMRISVRVTFELAAEAESEILNTWEECDEESLSVPTSSDLSHHILSKLSKFQWNGT